VCYPVPILVLLGLFVLDLGPMYETDVRQHHCLMPPPRGRGIITVITLQAARYHTVWIALVNNT